jgi:excisionase family DNA binding protein
MASTPSIRTVSLTEGRPEMTAVRALPRGDFEVRFLTVAEVAGIMRVSKMTVYRLVHAGELAAMRVGRSYRVPERAVQEYLRHSYMAGNTETA